MDNQNTKRNVIKEQWDVATMMPREFNKRSLTAKGLVAIWFAMAICVSLFTQSAELYTSLSVGQIIIVLFIAHYTFMCNHVVYTRFWHSLRYSIFNVLDTVIWIYRKIYSNLCQSDPWMFLVWISDIPWRRCN